MLYWSLECVCTTACRSKKCPPACWEFCADTGAASAVPPSLVGSFNESQFPTECHITPLNDLIKQSRHLLSPAISLFTAASTAVTQPPPVPHPPPLPAGVRWDQIAESQHLPAAINATPSLSALVIQHAITCLPTSGRRARTRHPSGTQRSNKAFSSAFHTDIKGSAFSRHKG